MVKLVLYLILFLNLKLLKKQSFRGHLNTLYGTKYSRMDQVKFMEDININQKLFPVKNYVLKIIPEILKIIDSKFKEQGIYNRLSILKFYLKKLGHVYMDSFSHFYLYFHFCYMYFHFTGTIFPILFKLILPIHIAVLRYT